MDGPPLNIPMCHLVDGNAHIDEHDEENVCRDEGLEDEEHQVEGALTAEENRLNHANVFNGHDGDFDDLSAPFEQDHSSQSPSRDATHTTVEDVPDEDDPLPNVPPPLDADEEILENDIYSNVKIDDLRRSVAYILAMQSASLDDPHTGLSHQAVERLRNPPHSCVSLDNDHALKLAIRLYIDLNHADDDYEKARKAFNEYHGDKDSQLPSLNQVKSLAVASMHQLLMSTALVTHMSQFLAAKDQGRLSPIESTMTVNNPGPGPAIGKRKELVAGKQTRTTAKGLCRIEWGQQHEGGTNSQFETFWKKLDLAERQKYANKLTITKTAKVPKHDSVREPAVAPSNTDTRMPNHDSESVVGPLNTDANTLKGVLEGEGATV
ncbi:hypothetical protein F4604DRAFT_1968295 [Suillus subluteus]|nr:hypothetical protein F4604DRAFT_1968295 [Suillus subluteus]